jgi:hypothetical protein
MWMLMRTMTTHSRAWAIPSLATWEGKFLMCMVQSKGDSNDIAKAMDKGIKELTKKKSFQLQRPADQQGGAVGLLHLERRS